MSLANKVALGMAHLDRVAPDWHYRVHVDAINMECECCCVLAQLYGTFTKALEKFNWNDKVALELGFLSRFQVSRDWSSFPILGRLVGRRLNRAWKKAILEKRAKDSRSTVALEVAPVSYVEV